MTQQFKTATKFGGLADYPNSLSEVPPGSLQVADNVVVDRPGTISARRGQRIFSDPEGGSTYPTRLFQVGADLFGLFTEDGLPTSVGDIVRVDQGSVAPTPAATGVFQPPGNAMHSVEANSNVYLSTGDGILKLLSHPAGDSSSGTTVPAGMPFGLDVQAALATPTGLGFLPGDSATGYAVVFGSVDNAGNTVLGAPSPTATLANPVHLDAFQNSTSYVAILGASATVFSINLGYTAGASKTYDPVYVVQGSTVAKARMFTTNTSPQAVIQLDEIAVFFGPSGTSVTVVIPASITSVSTSTTLNCSNLDTGGLSAASHYTAYTPFNSVNPADTSGAALSALVTALPSASSLTVASGVWTAGAVGLVLPCSINTAQTNAILKSTGGFSVAVNDQLGLTAVSARPTVTSVAINVGSSGLDVVNLDTFPAGLVLTGAGSVDVYRPQNATVTFTVPKEISAYTDAGLATFYQVYRSASVVPLNGAITGTPNPNMRLAYQGTLTGVETQITIPDIAPDATLGTALYTSPNQEGALAAKYPPPVASDMCLYQGVMLFANCFLPASFSTTLLGVSSTTSVSLGALQPGDILTINGVNFTARTSPSLSHEFKIFTGSGSVTLDIANTVADLSRVANQASVAPTSPGSALETVNLLAVPETIGIGGQFTIRVSRGVGTFTLSYTPIGGHPNPFADAFDGTFTPTEQQNALYYSPVNEPEAVPLLNSLPVGQANTAIQRVLPLPGSCIIFKPEGIYQLTGTTEEQFSVALLNTTAQLLANESAVILQSQVIAFTNQGVITVSQGGVQITSMAINDTLRALSTLPAFASTAFGVAHEAERRYMLWVPSAADDALPTQAYTYNILTNAWTRWPVARICGLVNRADQLLYTGATVGLSTAVPVVYNEASPGDAYPYGDDAVTGTLSVADATTVDLIGIGRPSEPIVANFVPGSALFTPIGVLYPTAAVNFAERVRFTVRSTAGLTSGDDATYYQGYTCKFAPVPISGEDPGAVKQFQEFQLSFVNTGCPFISATCYTDFNQDLTPLSLVPVAQLGVPGSGFGSGPFGGFAWGGGSTVWPVSVQNARQLVSKGATRGHYFWPLVTAVASAVGFNVQGLTLCWAPSRSLRSR